MHFSLLCVFFLPVISTVGVEKSMELPWKFHVLLHQELYGISLPLTTSGAGLGSIWLMSVEIYM